MVNLRLLLKSLNLSEAEKINTRVYLERNITTG